MTITPLTLVIYRYHTLRMTITPPIHRIYQYLIKRKIKQPLTVVEPDQLIKMIQGYGRVSLGAAREYETLMRLLI